MRITPGAAVLGVASGSAVSQTVTVLFLWVNVGPHYYATTWTLYAIEQYPFWLVAIVHLVEGLVGGLLPAVMLVPVLRRWPVLQTFPPIVAPIIAGVALACIPFLMLGMYLYPGDLLLSILGGSALALGISALASLGIGRRERREAAALAAAFADD